MPASRRLRIGVPGEANTARRANSGDPANAAVIAAEIEKRLAAMTGSRTEQLRAMRREFSRRLENSPAETIGMVATRLLKSLGMDHRFVAYELIHHHPAALASLDAKQLERFGAGIDSWGAVDCFGVFLAGPAWRERQVPDSLIHAWARSQDRWWRRAALVSTVPLNVKAQAGTGDAARTLAVCRLLESDRDPMVVKALSWALRALAKRDPGTVRKYLAQREDVLPALVLREVKNKLNTGLKNPKKRRQKKSGFSK
jgi:3-methyladenine DNA glycosylase AlkD